MFEFLHKFWRVNRHSRRQLNRRRLALGIALRDVAHFRRRVGLPLFKTMRVHMPLKVQRGRKADATYVAGWSRLPRRYRQSCRSAFKNMLGKLLGLGEALSAHRALFRVFDHLIQHVADGRPLSGMVLIYVYLKICYFLCSL